MFFPPTTAVEVFSLFCYTKRLQKFRFCIDNLMCVQPAFQGKYIHPINNLQTSLRLKTVKYEGSAASFLHTSWLPPAMLSRLPSPTWNLQLWLLLAEPNADSYWASVLAWSMSHHLTSTAPPQLGLLTWALLHNLQAEVTAGFSCHLTASEHNYHHSLLVLRLKTLKHNSLSIKVLPWTKFWEQDTGVLLTHELKNGTRH